MRGQPEMEERIASNGAAVISGTPQQFDARLRSEIAKWAKVIKEVGVHVD